LPVALLPISYGYAVLRFRKMAQDRWVARLIVYAFTTVIVVIVFFLLMALPWFQDLPSESTIWVAALVGGVVAGPLMRGIESWLGWLLFGRWTQPLQAAGNAMRTIDLRVERRDLSGQVRDIISRQLQIHNSAVLLLDRQNALYDPEGSGLAQLVEGMRLTPGSVLRRALDDNVWVREMDDIRTALLASQDQRAILDIPWVRAILPLRFDNKLTGLILIGYRSGVTFYDIDELIVLQLVAMSAAAAFHRRKLFLDLEQERDQASMLSQQVLGVRSEERKRVARELHDDIIQPLIVQSYGLAGLDAPTAPALRSDTLDLVDKVRAICAELREPTLDTLGLGSAVRAAVAAFQMRTHCKAELIVDQHPNAAVPDPVASAALGVLQEALSNANKHAQAQTIQVRVAIQPDVVRLNVRDDGLGFDVAEARRRAAQTNHFGLLGADERVAAVGGALNIQSLPGQGTNIEVYLPLTPQQEGQPS
jgi:signal transduction histidine kinase